MTKPIITIIALGGLLMAVGCSQSATNEPKKLDNLVVEEAAKPLPPAKPVVEGPVAEKTLAEQPAVKSAAPAEKAALVQAAFAQSADQESGGAAAVPPVLLSKQHEALSRVKVGDVLPEIALAKVGGGEAKLATLYGKAATVVVFWKGDRQMAHDLLADLGPDVVEKYGSRGVEVVGVAVNEPAGDAVSAIQKAGAKFPQLFDADGKAFERVGAQKFPWTFVLDANGKIVWFDLEYSLATRRELQQALLATVR